jgi:predicted phage terminase large subunit-like protein
VFKREWFRFYLPDDVPKYFEDVFQSWDMTFQKTRTGSYVVGQVWGRDGANFYLLDQVRERLSFTETIERFRRLCADWPDAHAKVVEAKANGPAIISALQDEIGGIIPWPPKGEKMSSKEARARSVAPAVAAGNVLLPKGLMFAEDLLGEAISFPRATHDDQVDAMVQALQYGGNRGSRIVNALARM